MLKENIMKTSKVIDIDTGCVYPGNEFGKLTAIEIPSKTLYTV
jgi:hypothetical protein